jgi:hypothetical protein
LYGTAGNQRRDGISAYDTKPIRATRRTPPTVHQMVLALERAGLIRRTPGAARSIKLLLPPENLPVLHRPDANSS